MLESQEEPKDSYSSLLAIMAELVSRLRKDTKVSLGLKLTQATKKPLLCE